MGAEWGGAVRRCIGTSVLAMEGWKGGMLMLDAGCEIRGPKSEIRDRLKKSRLTSTFFGNGLRQVVCAKWMSGSSILLSASRTSQKPR